MAEKPMTPAEYRFVKLFIRGFARLNVLVYLATGGRLWKNAFGRPICLVFFASDEVLLAAKEQLFRPLDDVNPDVALSNITATNLITGAALRRVRQRPV